MRQQKSEKATSADAGKAVANEVFVNGPRPEAAPMPPAAPNIVATKTAALSNDLNSDGNVDPGDTIKYTVTITNNGNADASGVQFNDTVDTHTTPVAGSAVVAVPDTYNTIGDVNINVAAPGPLANDFNPDTGNNTGMTVTSYGASTGLEQASSNSNSTPTATAQSGTVAINTDGSLTYDPPVGFTGTDTFQYATKTASSGVVVAKVTVTISGKIWFIDNHGGACTSNCDGRLSHPFTSLSNFNSANGGGAGKPAAGDSIFIYESGVGYTGPVTLLNNQKLIGQDATASLITITGLTQPSGTDPLPAMNSGNATIATINSSASNGINLAQGNTIRGLTISGTTGAKISGSSFGTLTVGDNSAPDVSLSGGGQALSLTTGTFAATSGFVGVASTSSTAQGISLAGVGGTVSFGSTSVSGSATQGILLGTTTANITFGNTTVSGGTDGVSFQNNSSGTRTFGTLGVSGGSGNAFLHGAGGGNVTVTGNATLSSAGSAVSVSAPGGTNVINFQGNTTAMSTGSGNAGVSWAGTSGASLTFNALAVQTNAGTGLSATTGGTVNVTNATTAGPFNSTVNNTTQAASAIIANGVALNANFSAIKSSGGTNGVSLTSVTGTSNFGGGALSGASGATFLVNNGTCSVTYSGNVTQATASQPLVSISGGHNTGTITFQTGTLSATNGTGLQFDNADGTYNFNGTNTLNGGDAGIDILDGSGGTFSFSANSSITSPTGVAFNIDGTSAAVTAGVTYSGTITQNSAASAVSIKSKTGGTTSFGGAITASTSTANAIDMPSGNAGSTVNFTGGLSLTTTSGAGFNAAGGGTVNVTGTNTVSNTTGTAVNIANTTIGASNVTFQSINHNASNSGTNSAIVLNNTGSGTFTVSGTGGSCTTGTPTCTGGTIQNVQGADGISMNTVGGLVTLNNMLIEDITASNDATAADDTRSGFDGIQAQAMSAGLTLNNTIIQRISDSGLNGSAGTTVPSATSINGLTISGCTILNTARFNVSNHADRTNEAAIYIWGLKGTVSVTNSTFKNDPTGMDFTTDTSGSLDLTVTGNTFDTLYKDFGTNSYGNWGVRVLQVGSLNSIVRIGDKNDANAALGNTFTNGGGLAAIEVITQNTSTGTMKAEVNRNVSTVTDHSSPGVPAGGTSYNFPQGGTLLRARGSGNYEAIYGHNTCNQCMHADQATIGNLSISVEKGTAEFIVQNNTFNLTWDAPVQIISNGTGGSPTADAQVLMTGNTYVGGTVGDGTTDLGGPSPYDPFYAQTENGGRLDLTIQNEGTFPANDASSGFSHGFFTLSANAGDILNLFLQNDKSVNGYELKASSGTTYNLYKNGSASSTAQGVLQDNGNTGGSNNANTVPPGTFLTGAGTVTLSNTAPTLPNITIAMAQPITRPEFTAAVISGEVLAAPRAPTAPSATSSLSASLHHAFATVEHAVSSVASNISPTAYAAEDDSDKAEESGAAKASGTEKAAPKTQDSGVRLNHARSTKRAANATALTPFANCSPSGISGGHICVDIGTLKQGDSVQISFQVTLNNLPNLDATDLSGGAHVANTGSVSGANFVTVNTTTATTNVDLFHSTTNLVSNNNPSDGGDNVTFTATVQFDSAEVSPTPNPSNTTPTGTVNFIDTSNGNAVVCSAVALSGSGGTATAQCPTSTLSAGSTHNIQAVYSGDGNFNTSTSNTVPQQVIACDNPSIVTKTADDGTAGTLRYAILHACVGAPVQFQIPANDAGHDTVNHLYTITLNGTEIPLTKDVSINGPNSVVNTDAIVVSGNNTSRVFNVNSGKTVTINNLTISGGNSGGTVGGGILNDHGTLTINNVTLSGNTASSGGGIYSNGETGTASVTIVNSTISGNTATIWGGGLYNDGIGGGAASMSITNSTISGNKAAGTGGGIRNFGDSANIKLTATNVTITNNTADSDDSSASDNGGGIWVGSTTEVKLLNTIVAGNFRGTSSPVADDIQGSGTVDAASSFNLIGTGGSGGLTTGVQGNQVGVADAKLGALANNGGPTKTHALLAGSTATDAGTDVTTLNGNIDNNPLTTSVTVADASAIPAGVGFLIQIDSEQMSVTSKTTNTLTVVRAANSTSIASHTSGTAVNPAFDQRGTPFARKLDGLAAAPNTPTVDIGAFEVQPPTAVNDSYSTNEDTPLHVNAPGVLSNDTGTGTKTATVSTGPSNASSFTLNSDGSFDYTPNVNFQGQDTFVYTVTDSGGSANATVTITVNSVNDAPTTSNNTVTVLEDHTYTFQTSDFPFADLADNPPNTLLNVIITSAPASGTLADNGTPITAGNVPFPVSAADLGSGKLTFAPAANGNGSPYATFNFEVQDNGGTANSGSDTSSAATMTVNVTAVNDPPSFTKGADQTVLEDAGAQTVTNWATSISAGPADESGQTLTFNVTNNTNTALFSVQPAVSSTGTLTYTPAANANGSATITLTLQDNGGTANGGNDTSAPQTFVINVTAVNDPPSFTKGGDQTVNEDAGAQSVSNWATNISAGPSDENGQTLTFNVTNNTNTALFSVQPAVSSSGTLTYTPAANANGSATITLTLSDNGGTANGGNDTSAPQTFVITVNPVADTPSVTGATTNEDTQTTSGLVISRNAADGSEVTNFKITDIQHGVLYKNDGTTQINNGDFITFAEGNAGLKFTPAPDFNDNIGTASFQVQASLSADNSGLGGGTATATIHVTAVNDAPSFTKGADQNVPINAGPQTVSGWATNIAPGPATATDETGQTVNFIVNNNNNGLFSAQPAVSSSGTLTYTPASNTSGQATVSVSLHDNGGTANNGNDTSAIQTFTITVGTPALTAHDAQAAEPASGTAKMIFTVSMSTALASQTVTVDYATADDTGGAHPATSGTCGSPGVDYQSTSGTLTFSPGDTIKTVAVTICFDGDAASNAAAETLKLNLSNASGATISGTPPTGTISHTNSPGTFIISEIRTSGPTGSADEFVELYNDTDSPLTIAASDASGGYGVFKMGADCSATPVLVAQIANGTVIPARGHYLLIGSQYSLANYGGTGAAAGDQTMTSDIENDRNVALFTTSDINNVSSANRLDAVGFGTNTDSGPGVCDLFREGSNLPAASGSTLQYSFFRKTLSSGNLQDTNDNSADFLFADTQGTALVYNSTTFQRLGAPGPQNKTGPILNGIGTTPISLLDTTKLAIVSPNAERNTTANTPNASTGAFGTLSIRGRIRNNTGGPITKLRFRIVDMTTFPNSGGNADLRAVTSADTSVSGINDTTTCVDRTAGTASNCTVPVKGTTLETPPTQSIGGGFNSSMSVSLPGGGFANNTNLELQFQFGVMQKGNYNICIVAEGLPGAGFAQVACYTGNTDTVPPTISKAFGAATVPLNGTTSLTFTINNSNPTTLTGLAFSDTLPGGLSAPNASTSACGGTLTVNNNVISLSGGTLAGTSQCTPSVTVTGTSLGTQVNQTGPISSTETGPGNPSNQASIDVVKSDTTTTLGSSQNPSFTNQLVTFTATVTSNTSVVGPPTGTVQFFDGVNPLTCSNGNTSTEPLDGTGKATCQTSTLTVAGSPHSINATYSGDGGYNGSNSNTVSQTVKAPLVLTVNSTADTPDANLNGVCDDGTGNCTLRAAIMEANFAASDDTINFNLPPNSTINLLTAIPAIDGNLVINGPGANTLTVQRSTAGGTPQFRVFTINSGKTVNISGLTISNGNVSSDGGGILNQGTLTLSACAVTGNSTTGTGGGIASPSGATLTITGSTISGNSATASGSGIGNGGTLTITNSTISANTGDGLSNSGASTLVNDTFSANTVRGITNSGMLNIGNTIVGNTPGGAADVAGAFTSSGNNIIGNASGSTGFTNGVNGDHVGATGSVLDPRVAVLANNGGTTQTNALLSGSLAIDGGNNTLATNNSLTTDQRGAGFNRFVDGPDADAIAQVDIGAFEAQPSIEDITDKSTNEDTPLPAFNFTIAGTAAVSNLTVTAASSNTTLVPNGNLTLGGSGSTRSLGITPAANQNGTTTITVTVAGTIGTAAVSMSDTFVLTVNAVNDAPTFNLGANVTVNEDAGPQTVPNMATNISAGPPDESGQTLAFTVTNNNNGLFSSQPAINPTGTLTFTSAPDANGVATVSVTLKDNGGTANGGNDTSVTQQFTITVNAVNDAPVNNVPGPQQVNENGTLTFSTGNANAISVSDVDAGSGAMMETLTATNGVITLSTTAGLNFTVGNGTNNATMTFTGTLANINAALQGMTFKPTSGYSGAASLQIVTNDQGNTGSGGPMSDTKTVNITVNSGGTLQFSAATYSVSENNGPAVITIARTGGSSGTATVQFDTSNGTATAGSDYTAVSQVVTFNNGETSKTVNVPITDDLINEPNETVNLTLSNVGGSATLGSPTAAVLTIVDNDPAGGYVTFSAANYNVNEGGVATITVQRTGTLTQAITVDFATSDNSDPASFVPCAPTPGNTLATSRCDFESAFGRISFAAGDGADKTFTVMTMQDNYVEGPETLTLSLANPTGGAAILGAGSALLTINDDLVEPPGNAIDDTGNFVESLYRDFLNRPSDPSGKGFWMNNIDKCNSSSTRPPNMTQAQCISFYRVSTASAFFLSNEFQQTGGTAYLTNRVAFGGLPTFVRFEKDAQMIGRGYVFGAPGADAILEANKVAYFNDYVSRPEFLAVYGGVSNQQYVDTLIQNTGVTFGVGERQQLIDGLNNATETRATVLRKITEKPQFNNAESQPMFVLMEYFGFLRRNPDTAGYNFWLNKLKNANGNFMQAEMVKAFIESTEYRQRFGTP